MGTCEDNILRTIFIIFITVFLFRIISCRYRILCERIVVVFASCHKILLGLNHSRRLVHVFTLSQAGIDFDQL